MFGTQSPPSDSSADPVPGTHEHAALAAPVAAQAQTVGVVRAVAHRLIILDAGRIAESGEARAVIGNPQSAIGKALVAATPKLVRAKDAS